LAWSMLRCGRGATRQVCDRDWLAESLGTYISFTPLTRWGRRSRAPQVCRRPF
jgi:hypothetical protein